VRSVADDANGSRSYSIRPTEEFLFGGFLPSMWLQNLLGVGPSFVSSAAYELWFSLFWGTPVLAATALILGGYRAFFRLLAVHAVLVFSADTIYALFPTRPVWMDAEVARVVTLEAGYELFDTNPVASLPSLHVGVPAAYAIWFWRQPDRRMAALGPYLTVWTGLIAWAVIYAGEHYVLCAVQGVLLALAANLLLAKLRWKELRPWRQPAPSMATSSGGAMAATVPLDAA
jgi:hypothetical protein